MPVYRDIDYNMRINGTLTVNDTLTMGAGKNITIPAGGGVLAVGTVTDVESAINAKLPLAGGTLTNNLEISNAAGATLTFTRPSGTVEHAGLKAVDVAAVKSYFSYSFTDASWRVRNSTGAEKIMLYDAGNISAVGLTLSGNITMSTAGATVDGIDLTNWKSAYDTHVGDSDTSHLHLTTAQKTALTGGASTDASTYHTHGSVYFTETECNANFAPIGHVGTRDGHPVVTTTLDGFMIAADKSKLDGIASSAEVNQNAFSNVAVSGKTTITADSKTATLNVAVGSNLTLATDNSTKTLTISLGSAVSLNTHNHDGTYLKADGTTSATYLNVVNNSGTLALTVDASKNGKVAASNGDLNLSAPTAGKVINADTDVVLATGHVVKEVGRYRQMWRVPLYGNAGDLQFEVSGNTWEDVCTILTPFAATSIPAAETGATREYALYVIYSDDIQEADGNGRVRLYKDDATFMGADTNGYLLDKVGTDAKKALLLAKFSAGAYAGNLKIQARVATSTGTAVANNRSLEVYWIELIAYDKY